MCIPVVLQYARAPILNLLVADTMGFEFSCNQILFVTLEQFGFRILRLDQSAKFLEHQIRKTHGPQEYMQWWSLLFRERCENNKACQVVGD